MITIFNRKELVLTRSMEEQARVRGILAAEGIDYKVQVNSARVRGINSADMLYEYAIFVRKAEYDKAVYLISK